MTLLRYASSLSDSARSLRVLTAMPQYASNYRSPSRAASASDALDLSVYLSSPVHSFSLALSHHYCHSLLCVRDMVCVCVCARARVGVCLCIVCVCVCTVCCMCVVYVVCVCVVCVCVCARVHDKMLCVHHVLRPAQLLCLVCSDVVSMVCDMVA